ncbi:glycoside hydrolase family 79 protein [Piloderma croceum F 1598]|uniref:Glycoside hydrolase family 79 protein n=1 Tax=Piloderma croceum (strain F 1598) TaxID=765440 RepID=A0A0C3FIX4_PILCF|nr:glycoside hydrolase family 79 protein [Piloderma croceum F 1598]
MYPSAIPSFLQVLLLFLLFFRTAEANVTVYDYAGPVTTSVSGVQPAYTGLQAYNPIVLNAPPLPTPSPANTFNINLRAAPPPGLSIKINGSFFGFSIEFSVLNQVLGYNSSVLMVPFLNLMANIRDRAGAIHIRVGGNTQETASMVDSLPNGEILSKDNSDTNNPTKTPPLVFTDDVIYMMANISALVNVYWFMGIPFNDTSDFRLQIAEKGQAILGPYLVGLQVGNEPDLYAKHFRRPANYSPAGYFSDFGLLVNAVKADPLITNPNMLIGPNLAGTWTPEMIWDTGFQNTYQSELSALAVERYPTDNCFSRYGYGVFHDAQQEFANYMTHASAQNILKSYLNSSTVAQSVNKPLLMFETNSASCGGFPGIADAFGAALWGLDYALQLAYSNFSIAMFHSSGQNVSYQPFTPAPTAQSFFHQWTIGPIYYAALIAAEVISSSNNAQVIDLLPNNASPSSPAYAIYENGNMVRVALFNYLSDDPTGNSAYTATISVGGSATGEQNETPASVKVKYLLADSVTTKGNITWANQTFGGYFASDGRLQGDEVIETVNCDTNANTCQIKVPAPGFALVFFTDNALGESENTAQQTFATTVQTRTRNTATINLDTLATSNGGRGMTDRMGSTSPESNLARGKSQALPSLLALAGFIWGGLTIRRML